MRYMIPVLCIWHCNTKIKPRNTFFLKSNFNIKVNVDLCLCSQQWLLDRQDLIRERQQDLVVLTEEEYQKIFIFFSNCKLINKLCFILQIYFHDNMENVLQFLLYCQNMLLYLILYLFSFIPWAVCIVSCFLCFSFKHFGSFLLITSKNPWDAAA